MMIDIKRSKGNFPEVFSSKNFSSWRFRRAAGLLEKAVRVPAVLRSLPFSFVAKSRWTLILSLWCQTWQENVVSLSLPFYGSVSRVESSTSWGCAVYWPNAYTYVKSIHIYVGFDVHLWQVNTILTMASPGESLPSASTRENNFDII